ncbi:hypothetical protein PIB30_011618 [Stylosanthes scabra]|uniref:Membrane-associated kinase regulator 4 n=1 Tax=Stylosanthes scabra TaxID=79078 RepID=A0ABU6V4V3_9FABA|nr:hypothetical protein [Stylosanthes scabra]
MASKLIAFDANADDDYIDMEVTSYSNFFCHSHSQPREFEFQMSSIVQEKDSTTSPADELFYKGKLLPLHLPPRLQMVEKILQNSDPPFVKDKDEAFEEFFSTPLGTTYTTPITGTPFESCNISPVESCHVSRELNPEEYKLEFPATKETSVESTSPQKKSWTKKLKHSSIGSKLRASRAYLKSWFGKSGCSYENYAASTKVADEGSVSNLNSKMQGLSKKKKNISSNNPYGQIRYESTSNSAIKNSRDDQSSHHRRSFSVGIKILSGNKSALSSSAGSSSFSIPNNSRQHLKRCSSASSEIENAIQGAIAHCKKSQQVKKNASEVGFYSFSEDQERVVLCRG